MRACVVQRTVESAE